MLLKDLLISSKCEFSNAPAILALNDTTNVLIIRIKLSIVPAIDLPKFSKLFSAPLEVIQLLIFPSSGFLSS